MNTEYLEQFVEEARENVEELVASLLRLETESGDAIAATVAELFRFAHNVKGMAATIGLEAITVVAHRMEDLFERYRQGGGRPDPDEIDLLLTGCDAVSTMIDEAATGGIPATPTELIARFDMGASHSEQAAVENDPAPEDSPAESAPSPATTATHRFTVTLTGECQLPGARAAMVVRTAGAEGTVVATDPGREHVFSGSVRSFAIDMCDVADPAALAEKMAGIADVADVAQTSLEPESKETDRGPKSPPRATVRVEIERLDMLMNLVSELVIARGQLEQQAEGSRDRGIQESVAGTARLISDLQAIVAKVRMVTLESTYRRMTRLVRDTSRSLEKQIEFETVGADTELDRRMVDELSDPLVHLLRNAVDHGVESEAERAAAGKSGRARVVLRAYHEGNQVVIEVSDDGAGIDVDRVTAKALERGIISPDDAAAMTPAQRLDLVFAPGLSTREEASTISGRGVGMDVVRSSVARLGGAVHVESTPAAGSTFRVRLPLSLAVLEALLVTVADETWAVPLAHIEETIVIRQEDLRWIQGDPVINLRGVTLPVVPGRWQLAGSRRIQTPTPAIVYQYKGRRCALTVDELLTQTEVVVKPLPNSLAADHVSGVTILGNGTVGLILDLDSLTLGYTARDRSTRLEFSTASASDREGAAATPEPALAGRR
jgi:two-component system chemotaxis sensor kinase CheA